MSKIISTHQKKDIDNNMSIKELPSARGSRAKLSPRKLSLPGMATSQSNQVNLMKRNSLNDVNLSQQHINTKLRHPFYRDQ